jgi:hypothetical protein
MPPANTTAGNEIIPLAVTITYRSTKRLETIPATVLARTSGAVLVRFERRYPYLNPGELAALLVQLEAEGFAVLLKPLDLPGRLTVDGGREISFAFVARDEATGRFLEALRVRQSGQ